MKDDSFTSDSLSHDIGNKEPCKASYTKLLKTKPENNSRVVAKGLVTGTFKGKISSYKNFKYPKDGLNSD